MCLMIAERNRAEDALRKSEERFRNTFEHAAIGFTIYTPDGRFLRVNQALCNILGYSEEELMTKTFQDITHQDDLDFYMDLINQALSGKLPVAHFQKRYIHKLGHEVWASVSVSVVRDDKGNLLHLISLVEDLSEKRKLEEQLRQSQKMEAVGKLAGGVAHDFNNILTAIMGYGSLALKNMLNDDPKRINIEHMLEGAERAAHLTNDLLLFSRKQISERKRVDLNEIIKKMETFLTKIIGEDISYKTILHPGAIPVLADAHQLEQVMMNLVTNARDAMPDGGVFSVTTERIRLDRELMTALGYGQPGMYAFITVSDTGKGMDKATRQRIFEPFFTTKDMGRGTGLGMAVVYGIVKGHGGYINVYSEPGLGTTFKIYLPLTSMEAEETAESNQPIALGKGETILIAEDEPQVREVLRISLEEYGYMVIEAENGEDAVKQYKDNMEKMSLILLDVIMPLKNGREVYDEIKSLNPYTKVIFMSGYTENIIKGLLQADTELIPKPIAPDTLLRKVREVLDM
ncbi:MAG: PAS domain S-box protein [Dissulfurispiraceae bacterium]